jgi:hypothetical protein
MSVGYFDVERIKREGLPSLVKPATDAGKSLVDTVKEAWDKLDVDKALAEGKAINQQNAAFKTTYAGTLGKVNTFPSELISTNRPIIEFRCLQDHSILKAGTTIYLPAPEGLSYSNSSTYDDSELGVFGGAILGGLNSIDPTKKLNEIGEDLLRKGASAFEAAKSVNPKNAILAAASGFVQDTSIKAAVGVAAGARFNPYVVTSFDGTNTREYTFEYKLIPSSAEEAATIKKISQLFQIAVYGEIDGGFLLKYPPKWKLTILVPDNEAGTGKALNPLSSFYECYLQNCDIKYNSSNNSYFRDNSPFETDISLTFKETKALHANEVAKLLIG